MSKGLSGHLVDSYYSSLNTQSCGPFGQPIMTSTPHVVSCGLVSYDPSVHGTQASRSMDASFLDISEATATRIATLQAKLNQKLGPEFISQRPGPGGGPKLTYAEGWKIINIANEVFGFNGWSSSVVSLTTDFVDFNEETKRYNVGVSAIVKVTLRDGVFHEDVGYGSLENAKSKGAALDKSKKEAVTDGLKRALRNFGNLLGNCLYDKSYAQEVVKIKVPPLKFMESELYRRPEFVESKPVVTAASSSSGSKPSTTSRPHPPISPPEVKAEPQQQVTSVSSGSSHTPYMHSAIAASTPHSAKAKVPMQRNAVVPKIGLNTPITTPAQRSHAPQVQTRPSHPANAPRVTFAQASDQQQTTEGHAAEAEAEESFTFGSEDDAFLAAIDLGEVDLGRPLGEDADLGRPIDFEEGSGGIGIEGSGSPDAVRGESSLVATGAGGAGQERQGQPTTNSTNTYCGQQLSSNPPARGNPTLDNQPSNPHNKQTRWQVPPTTKPNSVNTSSTSHVQQLQRVIASSVTNKSTVPHTAQAATSSSAGTENRRPVTPSVGAFHFPPGVNPLTGQNQNVRLQGMGLAQQQLQHQRAMGKREPLGQLDIGQRGDIKRARR